MAEDLEPGKASDAVQAAPVASKGAAVAAPASGGRSLILLGLAFVAVLLTLDGLFELARPVPETLPLGLGLLLWGLLDLIAQRRGLLGWKGSQAAIGNSVNLGRALVLLALGLWLGGMALHLARSVHPAVIITTGVALAALYLAVVLAVEMLVKGVRIGAQAFLLTALLAMVFSYYLFSIPFSYAWAAMFAGLAFASAAWSAARGVLAESPSLGLVVLLAILVLGAPLLTYTFQQAYTEEQPLFTPTLLIPRMRQVVTDLRGDVDQIRWAPVNTQPGQPGDVPFSDKVAFTDALRKGDTVKLFQQHESGLREILRIPVGAGIALSSFSDDGRRLAYTDTKGHAPAALYVLEPLAPGEPAPAEQGLASAPKTPFSLKHFFAWLSDALASEPTAGPGGPLAYRSRRLRRDVAPEPAHGQVWRFPQRQLYFSAPPGGPRNPDSAVLRVNFPGGGVDTLITGRALPAVSPNGKALLSVGFVPGKRYLEIADEHSVDGNFVPSGLRPFVPSRESAYFPAWNADQTQVLFIAADTGRLMAMYSNGEDHRPFNPKTLDSHFWRSEKQVPFLLDWTDTSDRFRVYRSLPDGNGEKLIYEAEGRDISAPQWSSDGKRVAFIVRGADKSEVVTVGSDGSWPRHFFTTSDALDELKWSPDGLKVAWICRRSDATQEIWTAAYDGLNPERVHVDDGELKGLSWSPRGKHLAVEQDKAWTFLGLRLIRPTLRNVLMVNLVDLHARVMTRYGILAHSPAFSPHGDSIAYFTDQDPWSFKPRGERDAALVVSQLY